jgi:hypothetical protein
MPTAALSKIAVTWASLAARWSSARRSLVTSLATTLMPVTAPSAPRSGSQLSTQVRRTPGRAAVSPLISISRTDSPLAMTCRICTSMLSAMSGMISRTDRPMCAAAGRPLISASRSLMRT